MINMDICKKKNLYKLVFKGIDYRFKLEKEYLLKYINFNDDDVVIDVGACIGEVSMTLNKKKN